MFTEDDLPLETRAPEDIPPRTAEEEETFKKEISAEEHAHYDAMYARYIQDMDYFDSFDCPNRY